MTNNPRIEVLYVSTVSKKTEYYSFLASDIAHLEGVGDNKSAIVLKDGTVVTLLMSATALAAKIDEGLSPTDLREYCGKIAPVVEPKVGEKMEDGSIFAGLTADGTQRIFALPEDLDLALTFNDAVKAVNKLNADRVLDHDDWQIPNLETLKILHKNQSEGFLRGTFARASFSDPDYLDWYWSFTKNHDNPSFMQDIRFSIGEEDCHPKNFQRLLCRPVRLEPVR